MYEQSIRFVPLETQKVLSDFIEKDFLSKHIRRVVAVSKNRRAFFVERFNYYFNGLMSLDKVGLGLHIIARLPCGVDDKALSSYLAEKGIVAFPYSKYFADPPFEMGLVMGFSQVSESIIDIKLKEMSFLCKTFINDCN